MMALRLAFPPASVTSILSDHSQSTKCFSVPLPCLLHPSPGKPIIGTGDSLPSGSREPSLSVRCETSSSLACPMALSQEETQGWVVALHPDSIQVCTESWHTPLRPPPVPHKEAQEHGAYQHNETYNQNRRRKTPHRDETRGPQTYKQIFMKTLSPQTPGTQERTILPGTFLQSVMCLPEQGAPGNPLSTFSLSS